MCAKWAGKIVNDSINENIRTIIVTKGMIFQICARLPLTDNMGEKVAIVVSTANVTGIATWLAPLIAAS